MAFPEPVGDDACRLSRRWLLDPVLAEGLVALNAWAVRTAAAEGIRWPGVYIISGYRTRTMQASLNPDSPNSRHTACPSLAADLRVGSVPTGTTGDAILDWLGAKWILMGFRWGGMFTNPVTGLADRPHFDLG
jgi:hypothetical protein